MATTPQTNYYAAGRNPTLDLELVQIFSRVEIHQADRHTDEGKIDAISGTVEAIAEHSDHEDRDTQPFREEIEATRNEGR